MNNSNIVFILGSVWPEPGSSAAGIRMLQLMELFCSKGWEIVFGTAAGESDYSADLAGMGIRQVNLNINDSGFDNFVRELNPSIVLFDRFMVEEQFGWRVAEHCPQALRILDTEDLHCLRRARQKALKEFREFKESDLLSTDVARREIASIYRSDISLIISDYELKLLSGQFKVDPGLLFYLPFLTKGINENTISNWPAFGERENFVTIGNFLHEPNCDSVIFIKEEVWPIIRKALPEVEMHIYGAYPMQKITQLNNPKQGFIIKGRAEDAFQIMRKSRVCLAPLRFGAGLKGKLLDSMLCGTPSVTTHIGAEAMHGKLAWNGTIADTAEDIAAAAIQLYTNESAWQLAQTNGIKIVNECFLGERYDAKFLNRIDEIKKQLTNHRNQNFIGEMLMHHTMASTKFMSRWIEAKNSKPDQRRK